MIQEHYQEDRAQEGLDILENLKKTWACKECSDGYLQIFLYNKVGTTWYYRVCSNAPGCKNRTTAQKYSPEVKGIIKE
jgi:rubrerythrin